VKEQVLFTNEPGEFFANSCGYETILVWSEIRSCRPELSFPEIGYGKYINKEAQWIERANTGERKITVDIFTHHGIGWLYEEDFIGLIIESGKVDQVKKWFEQDKYYDHNYGRVHDILKKIESAAGVKLVES